MKTKYGNTCSTIHLFTWNRIALSMFLILSMTTEVLNHTHSYFYSIFLFQQNSENKRKKREKFNFHKPDSI